MEKLKMWGNVSSAARKEDMPNSNSNTPKEKFYLFIGILQSYINVYQYFIGNKFSWTICSYKKFQ